MFKRNVGLNDRVVRIVMGLALVAMVFVGPKIAWGWLGLLPVISGLVGWCPVYKLLKIDSRPPKRMQVGF